MTAVLEQPPLAHRYTAADLLTMPDGDRYELVDGELRETTMGARASWAANRLGFLITGFVEAKRLGTVFNSDASYRCYADDPQRVRKPDVSFVGAAKLPLNAIPEGFLTVSPDLVAEVVSPSDVYTEIRRKVLEYLRAGVSQVWVLDPESRSVEVWRSDGRATLLTEHATLDGEDVLPGFSCPVDSLFPPREQPSPDAEQAAPTGEQE